MARKNSSHKGLQGGKWATFHYVGSFLVTREYSNLRLFVQTVENRTALPQVSGFFEHFLSMLVIVAFAMRASLSSVSIAASPLYETVRH